MDASYVIDFYPGCCRVLRLKDGVYWPIDDITPQMTLRQIVAIIRRIEQEVA